MLTVVSVALLLRRTQPCSRMSSWCCEQGGRSRFTRLASCESCTASSSRLRRAKTVGERACCPVHCVVVLEPAHCSSPLSMVAAKHCNSVVVVVAGRSMVEPPLTGEHETEMIGPSTMPFSTWSSAKYRPCD